jgi:hypothetical protein
MRLQLAHQVVDVDDGALELDDSDPAPKTAPPPPVGVSDTDRATTNSSATPT